MNNKKEKTSFMSEKAEQLAIKDTLSSLNILIPLVALLQVVLVVTWVFDMTGDRYAKGSYIYLNGYIFMFLASMGVGFALVKFSKDIEKYRESIFHAQMTYAWMLPVWAAILTTLDAINASYTFSTQFYVMANVLTMGICYMSPKKWTLIQSVTGVALIIAATMMPMTEHFTFMSELIAYIAISIIAGRFVFQMKMNNYERQAELTQILDKVEYDSLTGLYTRESFYRKVEDVIKKNPNKKYTFIVSDIDDFKQINSIYGNEKGNEVLCYLAKEYMPYGLIMARYGADQFITLVPSPEKKTKEQMDEFATYIIEKAPVPNLIIKYGYYDMEDEKLPVSVMCDRALLAAKSIHRDYTRKILAYNGELSQEQLKAKRYASEFKKAIEKREFVLWYQPKVNPYTGKVEAAEALVRWKKEEGILFPGEFLNVFEENGQIEILDEYIFRSVCQQQKKWQDEGKTILPISINLSRKSMARQDLVEVYKNIVEETGISIDMVPIEIMESTAIRSVLIRPIVQKLCDSGFSIHMDDFGSGQSSINGLNLFRIDVVKIDKSLVDTLDTSSGRIILSGLMNIIKELGFHMVAEGVENQNQLQFLMEHHVDEIQGYYYSKPLPLDAYESYVEQNL